MSPRRHAWLLLLGLAACPGSSPVSPPPPPKPVPAPAAPDDGHARAMTEAAAGVESEALATLLKAHWAWTLENDPIFATRLGVKRHDGRLRDYTTTAEAARRKKRRALRAQAQAIDPATLTPQDRLSHELLLEELENAITSEVCRFDEWTVNARSNPITRYNRLPEDHKLRGPADVETLLARYEGMETAIDEEAKALRRGAADGLFAPAESVRRVLVMVDEQLAADPATWAMSKPVKAISDPAKSEALMKLIVERIKPALTRYRAVLHDEILPKARPADRTGLAALSLGPACYQARIRSFVTLSMPPEEVHQIGLKEIERTDAEMAALGAEALETEDLPSTLKKLREDPKLYFSTSEEVEEAARATLKEAKGKMKAFFGVLPKADCVVKRIPDYEAPFTTIAYYRPPHGDGSKPGEYYVNVLNPKTRPRYQARVLAVHESIPGHHLQIAIAKELKALPAFRKHGGFTAFVEGWGLYTERLGAEMDLYPTLLDRIGVVSFDAWRAGRLVVDTGIHHLGWSRDQAKAFLEAHTALAKKNIDNEVDRYINWPGQALAYKLGQLELVRLRREAKDALGPRFSLPAFHDAVLTGGAMSLPALRRRVQAWYQADPASPSP